MTFIRALILLKQFFPRTLHPNSIALGIKNIQAIKFAVTYLYEYACIYAYEYIYTFR